MRGMVLFCLVVLFLSTNSSPVSGEIKISPGSRRAVAFALDGGRVFVSWRYLESDGEMAKYEVKRSDYRTGPYTMGGIFRKGQGTNFIDSTRTIGKTSFYFITTPTGTSWIMDIKSAETGDPCLVIPIQDGSPCSTLTVGDLNGDGLYELIICRKNKKALDLEAYTLSGEMLWSNNLHTWIKTPDITLVAWDVDADGRDEVIVKYKENGIEHLVALDPVNGKQSSKTVQPNQLPEALREKSIACQAESSLSLFWNGNNQRELAIAGKIVCRDSREALATYKGRPADIADILGDWREELITIDSNTIRIYTTGIPTSIRRPSLMDTPR